MPERLLSSLAFLYYLVIHWMVKLGTTINQENVRIWCTFKMVMLHAGKTKCRLMQFKWILASWDTNRHLTNWELGVMRCNIQKRLKLAWYLGRLWRTWRHNRRNINLPSLNHLSCGRMNIIKLNPGINLQTHMALVLLIVHLVKEKLC